MTYSNLLSLYNFMTPYNYKNMSYIYRDKEAEKNVSWIDKNEQKQKEISKSKNDE